MVMNSNGSTGKAYAMVDYEEVMKNWGWVVGIVGLVLAFFVVWLFIDLISGSSLRIVPVSIKGSAFFMPNIVAAMLASIGVIIGGFGPWVTVLGFSRSAVGGDGTAASVLGGIALIALFTVFNLARTEVMSGLLVFLALIAALLGGLACAVAVLDINTLVADGSVEIFQRTIGPEIGWGLWAVTISSVVLTVTSLAVVMVVRSNTNRAHRRVTARRMLEESGEA